MIRVIIELVPDGINSLKQKAEEVVIACKFPLNEESQDLYIFSEHEKKYAEVTGYNLKENLYVSQPRWLEIAHMAISELLNQNTYRKGGEFFPGMVALDPVEFDQKIAEMIDQHRADIKSIRLFGRRINEDVNIPAFVNALAVFSKEKYNMEIAYDGEFLLKEYPGYIPYYLALRLDPQLYKDARVPETGRHFNNWGEFKEFEILFKYCLRTAINIPDAICFNGLFVYFLRPDGSIAAPLAGKRVTKLQDIHIAVGSYEHDYTLENLKAEIKAGNLIYSKRAGQHKYPGVKG